MTATAAQRFAPQGRSHRVVVERHGGPEVLKWRSCDLPLPGAGEVRVAVEAAGVSAYDLMFRRSKRLPGTPPVPFVLGEDVVGVVDALGNGVEGLERGERVAASTLTLGVGGGYAEHVCLPARQLVSVPDGVDGAEAVCVVINYLTAHMALHRVAKVEAGQRILVHGAAGGVGSAMLDLAQLAKVEAYGTASADNHDRVRALGATPIDYRTEDFVARIRSLTTDGVDAVFDPIGGGRQLWRSYRALRAGGSLIWLGVAASKRRGLRVIPATLLMHAALSLIPDGKRIVSFEMDQDEQWYRATLEQLLADLAAGRLHPIVAARIPMAEAARAHDLLENHRYAGKVVLVT